MSSSILRCQKNYKLSGYEILDLQEIHISFICFNQFHSDSQSPPCQAGGKLTQTLLATCDPGEKQRQELNLAYLGYPCHPHWASPLWFLEIRWPSVSMPCMGLDSWCLESHLTGWLCSIPSEPLQLCRVPLRSQAWVCKKGKASQVLEISPPLSLPCWEHRVQSGFRFSHHKIRERHWLPAASIPTQPKFSESLIPRLTKGLETCLKGRRKIENKYYLEAKMIILPRDEVTEMLKKATSII